MVSSISSSSSYNVAPVVRHPKPDPAKLATSMFSALDTKGQGFIEKSDLSTALQNLSQSSGQPQTLDADAAFSQLDTNADGKITPQEFADDLKAMLANMQSQGMPADGVHHDRGHDHGMPPSADAANGAGLSKDFLTNAVSSATDARSKSELDDLIANFDAIDSDHDNKISAKEVMSYKQAQMSAQAAQGSDGTQKTAAEEADLKLLRIIMKIASTYGVTDAPPLTQGSSSATSSVSVTA